MEKESPIVSVGWEREIVNRVKYDGTRVRSVCACQDVTSGELVEFIGKGAKNVSTPQGQGTAQFDFPIGNCKTWEEAWSAFDEAESLQFRILQADQAKAQNQQLANQQAEIRAQQIRNAIGGVVMAR